jgi:hypothetical protein
MSRVHVAPATGNGLVVLTNDDARQMLDTLRP